MWPGFSLGHVTCQLSVCNIAENSYQEEVTRGRVKAFLNIFSDSSWLYLQFYLFFFFGGGGRISTFFTFFHQMSVLMSSQLCFFIQLSMLHSKLEIHTAYGLSNESSRCSQHSTIRAATNLKCLHLLCQDSIDEIRGLHAVHRLLYYFQPYLNGSKWWGHFLQVFRNLDCS